MFTYLSNNTITVHILNDSDFTIISKNNTVVLDENSNNVYLIDKYIKENGNTHATTIVTDSLDATKYLYSNEMLDNCYITDKNISIIELEKNNIPYTKIKEKQNFTIDNINYFIYDNNVYFDSGYISFSNIKNNSSIYKTNIQNNIHTNNDYDIIINDNDKVEKINITNNKTTKFNIFKNYITIGEK